MNREQLAWAAGIVDGEGCIRNSPSRRTLKNGGERIYYCPTIKVTQSSRDGAIPEMLLRLQKLFPGSQIWKPSLSTGNRLIYDWALCNPEKVQAALCMLWIWLGSVKKKDAISMMNQYFTSRKSQRLLNAKTKPRDELGRFLSYDRS